jgi:hypothetical protein
VIGKKFGWFPLNVSWRTHSGSITTTLDLDDGNSSSSLMSLA